VEGREGKVMESGEMSEVPYVLPEDLIEAALRECLAEILAPQAIDRLVNASKIRPFAAAIEKAFDDGIKWVGRETDQLVDYSDHGTGKIDEISIDIGSAELDQPVKTIKLKKEILGHFVRPFSLEDEAQERKQVAAFLRALAEEIEFGG
jgi:hypothetical protein